MVKVSLMNDWDLIEAYARERSESAFKALVERHSGLVYGSALRQLRDPQLAQDVTQAVFVLLARKAASLRRGIVLSGWLFRTTRFLSLRVMRSEQRRSRREQEAFEMQELNSADEAWRRMEPAIDEALERLGNKDRDAILLRYVEGRNMRELSSQLNITEEAAKKRVTRAVEKLRSILKSRGISASTITIGGALAANANVPVPATVLTAISSTVGSATTSGPVTAMVSHAIAAWRWAKIRWVAGVAATAVLITTLVAIGIDRKSGKNMSPAAATAEQAEIPSASAVPVSPNAEESLANTRTLRFRAIAADTGEGIANARLTVNFVTGRQWEQRHDLRTDSEGQCLVPYPSEAGRMDIGVFQDGWEVRTASWPAEGHRGIAEEYTLRLQRVTNFMAGWVRDLQGRPVRNAEIWFQAGGGSSAHRESPREWFGLMSPPPVAHTDAQGRWSIGFIPNQHSAFGLTVRHADSAETTIASVGTRESRSAAEYETLEKLWSGELVTIMKPAFTLTGTVVDEDGQPISRARVQKGEQQKIFTTDADGKFSVPGLPEGPWHFTASADGFAPIRTNAEIAPATSPVTVTLRPGATLRIRVVDEYDMEIPQVTVGIEQWGQHRNALEWAEKTGWDGRLEWRSAPPDAELLLYARKNGFCIARDAKVKADGEEHTIRLRHALDVYGRVVDASAHGIRDFRAIPGYGGPQRYHDSELRWFALDTVRGTNGLFKLTFDEDALPWQVRIVAEGYEDWISEPLETNAQSVPLDIALKRSTTGESVRGTVLKPDGTPAAGAQVALLSLEHNVRLLRTSTFTGNARWLATCDNNGKFRFSVNRLAHSVAAVSGDGYTHMRIRDAREPVTLRLQPWGRVEGMVDASAAIHPVETIELYDPAADNYQGRVSLLGNFSTKVDASRHFVFENVPPGEFSLFINSFPSLRGLPFHHQTPTVVEPGETTYVVITQQPGTLMKGRLIAPAGKTINWSNDLMLVRVELVSSRPPIRSSDERKIEAVEFWTSEAGREFVNARRMISFRLHDDGSFTSVERVPRGDYQFHAIFKNATVSKKLAVTADDQELSTMDLGVLGLR